MAKSIYFLNLVLIVVVCELNKQNIDAKPRTHYGRCTVYNTKGFCITEDQCDTLDSSDKEVEPIFKESCKTTQSKYEVICCPISKLSPDITTATPKLMQTKENTRLPEPPECGSTFSFKITGGVNTTLTEFPWMALIRYTDDGSNFQFFCGGILISTRWVLTAAHCLEKQRLVGYRVQGVRLGEWNTQTNPDCVIYKNGEKQCSYHKDIDVDRIITHSEYTGFSTRFIHDIALLHLTEAATPSLYIYPICLPPPKEDRAEIDFAYEQLDISGWGLTEDRGNTSPIKLKTTLTVLPVDICNNTLSSGTSLSMNQPTKLQFCAKGSKGESSCNGDSGGPIMGLREHTNGNNYYYVYGIISNGLRVCSTQYGPVIFTKVENYITWIRDRIESIS